jgi:hypothetical protein
LITIAKFLASRKSLQAVFSRLNGRLDEDFLADLAASLLGRQRLGRLFRSGERACGEKAG